MTRRTPDETRPAGAVMTADRITALEEVLTWYAEQALLCRLIHSDGDAGRHALAADGGRRARAALAASRAASDCQQQGLVTAQAGQEPVDCSARAIVMHVWGMCEAIEDEACEKAAKADCDHSKGFWAGQKLAAKTIRRSTEMPFQPATTAQDAARVLLAADLEAQIEGAMSDAVDETDDGTWIDEDRGACVGSAALMNAWTAALRAIAGGDA